MLRWLIERKRRQLLAEPAPVGWEELVARAPSYGRLDEGEQARLFDLVRVFVAEKRWEACGGLELTDEVRVTVAANACVMLIGRPDDLAVVHTLLVYPTAVKLPEIKRGRTVAVSPGTTSGVRLPDGELVLAWDAVLEDAAHPEDGANVIIHVLAHALDAQDGRENGIPAVRDRAAWVATMQLAFDAQRDGRGVLREQAGDTPTEFFAVAAEEFFERPVLLASQLPAIYALLREYFALDLAGREPQRGPYR